MFDEMCAGYWTQSEYTHMWQLCFEHEADKKPFLIRLLRHLPSSMGNVQFIEDFGSEQFVVLFTHDVENDGARENQVKLFTNLIETKGIEFFAVEGAVGDIDLAPFRGLYQDVNEVVAKYFYESWMISPIEAVAMSTHHCITLWGMDDKELYLNALNEYRSDGHRFWDIMAHRTGMIYENLAAKLAKMPVTVAGVCVNAYNFFEGLAWLHEKKISHAGIWATSFGHSHEGYHDKALRGKPITKTEAFLTELYGDEQDKRKKTILSIIRPRKNSATIHIHGSSYTITIMTSHWINLLRLYPLWRKVRRNISRVYSILKL
jgi:hypothetical protein